MYSYNRTIIIGNHYSLDGNSSSHYSSLSPSNCISIVKLNIFKKGSIHFVCNDDEIKLCSLLCHLLAINPFQSVSIQNLSPPVTKFNIFYSSAFLLIFFIYTILYILLGFALLFIGSLLGSYIRPQKFNSLATYRHCIYFTSSLIRPSLRGGAIGHIKGVLSVINSHMPVSLFSTRDFFSELPISNFPRKFVQYFYPEFIIPDIDIYALAVSFHQILAFCRNFSCFSLFASKQVFIYTRFSRGSFAAALISSFFRLPLVVEYNGSEVSISKLYSTYNYPFSFLSLYAENFVLNSASRVVTVSEVLANELSCRYPDKTIKWYPNCADLKLTAVTPNRPRDYISFSYASTFGRWHGADIIPISLDYMIKHPLLYPSQNLPKFKFHIVGNGITYANFIDLITRLSLDDFFELHGSLPHEETLRIISDSHFSLLPTSRPIDDSPFIGSPTKLFEYMALGSIPIASNLDQQFSVIYPSLSFSDPSLFLNSSSTICDDLMGLVFEADSYRAFADALYFACSNYKSISHVHANCRSRVVASFTWDANVSNLLG